MRFMTAVAALQPGVWALKGTERMHRRPIGPLVEALRQLGAPIEYLGEEGYPPLKVIGGSVKGGKLRVDASQSSQFLSALALIAPFLEEGIELELMGEPASLPYFHMTLSILKELGVPVQGDEKRVRIERHEFPLKKEVTVEADHSASSFWYEVLAIDGEGELELEGLNEKSAQGDRMTGRFFESLGVETEWEGGLCRVKARPELLHGPEYRAGLRHHPDLAPALAGSLVGMGRGGELSGVEQLRIKESDRLEVLRTELEKAGGELEVKEDLLRILPSRLDPGSTPHFDPHDDHRIAMALAPLALCLPSLTISDPEVVNKSYPRFWEHFEALFPGSVHF